MKNFVATGPMEGKTFILNDRYSFVDGKMPCSDDDAEKIKPILCGFYACTLETIEEKVEETPKAEASLSKAVTQNTNAK